MSAWFLTGGTGFLGAQLLKDLSGRGEKIFALARPKNLDKMRALQMKGVEWVGGDLLNPDVIEDPSVRQKVLFETTGVAHLGALYDLQASRKDLYLCNVVGTSHVLRLADAMPGLKAFHYTSTIAVAGNYAGLLGEEMFDVGQTFPDGYAATKFAAESAVRQWQSSVPRIVHRLGVLVGHSETGAIAKIDGPYYLLRLLSRMSFARGWVNATRMLTLPFNEHTRLYMVPVDVTARAMGELMAESHQTGLHTYHLTGDPHGAPIRTVLREMLEACGYDVRLFSVPSNRWIEKLAGSLDIPAQTLFYMNCGARYDNQRFARRLPNFQIPYFETYAAKLLAYALENLVKGGPK